jgi:hypothetical protein
VAKEGLVQTAGYFHMEGSGSTFVSVVYNGSLSLVEKKGYTFSVFVLDGEKSHLVENATDF